EVEVAVPVQFGLVGLALPFVGQRQVLMDGQVGAGQPECSLEVADASFEILTQTSCNAAQIEEGSQNGRRRFTLVGQWCQLPLGGEVVAAVEQSFAGQERRLEEGRAQTGTLRPCCRQSLQEKQHAVEMA